MEGANREMHGLIAAMPIFCWFALDGSLTNTHTTTRYTAFFYLYLLLWIYILGRAPVAASWIVT